MTPAAGGLKGTLRAGERVLIIDAKSRRYLLTLQAGAVFHTHAGIVAHDDVIGSRIAAPVVWPGEQIVNADFVSFDMSLTLRTTQSQRRVVS